MKEHRSWHVATEDSVLRQQTFSVTTEFSCRSHPHYSWNKYGEERTVRILSSLFESIVSSICYSPRTRFAVISQRDATHNYYHSASMKTNSSQVSVSHWLTVTPCRAKISRILRLSPNSLGKDWLDQFMSTCHRHYISMIVVLITKVQRVALWHHAFVCTSTRVDIRYLSFNLVSKRW